MLFFPGVGLLDSILTFPWLKRTIMRKMRYELPDEATSMRSFPKVENYDAKKDGKDKFIS